MSVSEEEGGTVSQTISLKRYSWVPKEGNDPPTVFTVMWVAGWITTVSQFLLAKQHIVGSNIVQI